MQTRPRPVILITGCASGIGLDAARTLAARGWRVFATCRQPADCARLAAEGFESFPLDYSDPQSVAQAAREALDRSKGGLDALFNNGAFALPGAVEDIPRDGLRAIFETNLFGVHDLTCRVIPAMRAQGRGRIVNCSSVLGLVPAKWRGAYVATKYAMEGLTDVLRLELAEDTAIRVSLIEPGAITTELRQKAIAAFERWIDWESSARAAQYRDRLLPRLYAAPGRKDRFELPPAAVTRKLIHAVEAPRPRARYYVSTPTRVVDFLRRVLPTAGLDWILRRSG